MRFYIGCELKAVPNWRDILPPVQAPANYKDPQKIAAYIVDMTEKLEHGDAASGTLSGTVSRAVIITPGKAGDKSEPDSDELLIENGQPKIILDESGPASGPSALDCIMDTAGVKTSSELEHLAVFGVNIRQNARLMALQYVHIGGQLPFQLHWAVDFDPAFGYNQIPGFVDPLHVLFGLTKRWGYGDTSVDPVSAGYRLGLPVNPQDAKSLAVFSFQLSKRLGL